MNGSVFAHGAIDALIATKALRTIFLDDGGDPPLPDAPVFHPFADYTVAGNHSPLEDTRIPSAKHPPCRAPPPSPLR